MGKVPSRSRWTCSWSFLQVDMFLVLPGGRHPVRLVRGSESLNTMLEP